MTTEYYKIIGMSCAACSASVERVTRALPGVQQADVNLIAEKLTITYDESQLSSQEIMDEVDMIGFGIEPLAEGESAFAQPALKSASGSEAESSRLPENPEAIGKKEITAALCLSALLLYISMGQMLVEDLPVPDIISMHTHPVNFAITQMLLAISVMFIGKRYFVSGLRSLYHKAPNMDTLVAVSCSCSFAFSLVQTYLISDDVSHVHNLYFESAAVVLALVMLGKHLESSNKEKTKSAIKGMLELAPDNAWLMDERGGITEVKASELKPGDNILIRAGERVPMDGIVTSGSGGVDESMFTGESLPVHKEPGSEVIGGSLNKDGVLYVQVSRVGQDTTLAGIIRFVEDAQGKKAPIAKMADKVAGIFVPSVMCIALVSGIAWLLLGQSFAFALKVFTAVLVIACPCALGLATPTAIIVGTGLGANHGILIRSGESLEITHKADVAVFDKTGTITAGDPSVSDILAISMSEDELLALCASAETLSDHPLAKAVVKAYEEDGRKAAMADVENFEYISGKGLRCTTGGGRLLLAGNAALMNGGGIDTSSASEFADSRSGEGKSLIYIALDGVLAGVIALADTIKPGAKEALARLKDMGLELVLLTGDNMFAANYIGGQVGVDRVIAGVLPDQKAAVIEELQKQGKTVLMVGDGINDAPALVQADVGCAVGTGSDIAIDSADIVLMKDDLKDVARAVRLSKLTITNIKQNLFWAFFYNCIGIPVAAGLLYPVNGMLLSPMIGGLAMGCSSFFVVTNALRLKTKKLD